MTDYYKVLGISRDATPSDIKAAFRRLAVKFHPDKHVSASEYHRNAAGQRFKELSEAYEVLGDEKKRRIYNRDGRAGFGHRRPGTQYGAYDASARSDAYRGTYRQDPFYSTVHPKARRSSPFRMQWTFLSRFSKADYLAFGVICIAAFVTLITAEKVGDGLWNHQNNGKSFEETIEALEQRKQEKIPREGSMNDPSKGRT